MEKEIRQEGDYTITDGIHGDTYHHPSFGMVDSLYQKRSATFFCENLKIPGGSACQGSGFLF